MGEKQEIHVHQHGGCLSLIGGAVVVIIVIIIIAALGL
jgi:hypothetical protein